jgi:hypothetical protein
LRVVVSGGCGCGCGCGCGMRALAWDEMERSIDAIEA